MIGRSVEIPVKRSGHRREPLTDWGKESPLKRRYVTIDVFTDRMFGGNPLAVVLDAAGLSTSQMQAIAIEFNYSETTFILPPKYRDHSAWVRIFTPGSEIPFAGHPNVGTAFALAGILADRNESVPERFVFEEGAGLVPVTLIQENGAVIGAELLAPERLSRRGQVAPETAAACLSLTAEDIRTDRHWPQVFSVGLPFLIVELASRDALRRAVPSGSGYDKALPLDGARAVYSYVRPLAGSPSEPGSEIQARNFSPRLTEDPATGSATAAAAAMLAETSDPSDGALIFRFAQGVDMGRPSLLRGARPQTCWCGERGARWWTLHQRHAW
jgi:trans-2,3-dihydro-3-hydroxyanthranilate isomerase